MTIKSIKFHIKSDDYFATLATVLSLMKQDKTGVDKNKVIKRLVRDLMFLQNNYKITKK